MEYEPAPSAYFRSPIENVSGSNRSVTHNENASSHFFSPLFFPPALPQFSQENTSSEPEGSKESEQLGPFNRPQRLTVKPTDYAKLHNSCNLYLKKLENDNSQQKMRFAVRQCKINLGSDTPQNYQKAVSSPEKIQWIKTMQEEFHSHQVNKT